MTPLHPTAEQIAPLQTQLYSHITSGTTAKVQCFLKEHPELLNEPFANGSLPLHTSIRLHRRKIALDLIKMNADAIKKDSRALDALEQAYISGEPLIAKAILKNISKSSHSIRLKIALLHQITLRTKLLITQANSTIPEHALAAFTQQRDTPDENNQVPLERAIREQSIEKFVILFVCGANLKAQSSEGHSLLHLALCEQQLEIAHLLLIGGLDPNEKDSNRQTLLDLAASKSNLEAVYLLLAYGATLTGSIPKTLEKIAKAKDPLQISNSDMCYFGATIAYWLSRGYLGIYPTNTYLHSLPMYIHLLGAAAILYQQLPVAHALTIIGLEMLPATNIALQAWRASQVALSAFFGIQSAWEGSSEEPKRALQKGIIHLSNTFQCLYTLKTTIATEYTSSQNIQALLKCTNITSDDIATYESMPAEARMEHIVLHNNAASCPPLLELAFPSWNCNTFKKLYREEVFKHHPDKNKNGSSTVQIVLNAAKRLWTLRCEK